MNVGAYERDPYSRDYHLHSGSNLLNELTNYGEIDLFGGNDLAAVHAGLSMKMASDSHLLPWLFYYWGLGITSQGKTELLRAYTTLLQQLINAGLRPKIQRMDNEVSNVFKAFLQAQHITLELTPAHVPYAGSY
jgi:hypothetical protein